MKKKLIGLALILASAYGQAQNGLEKIVVEKYYVSNAADAAAADADAVANGHTTGTLPVGSVTYRIYADMLPGYKFQAIYGVATHSAIVTTTTQFYNYSGGNSQPNWSKGSAKNSLLALDSWFSVGAAANGQFGVIKPVDDGVLNNITVANNPSGILLNADPSAGIPLTTQDGMVAGSTQAVTFVGFTNELDQFSDGSVVSNSFSTTNGSIASLNGSTGQNPDTNRVLIAQITTNGRLHFEFNIQIGTPSGDAQNYVAKNATGAEISMASLTFDSPSITASIASFANATCAVNNGTIALETSGGTPPYTYTWAPSGGTGATATGLGAHTYTVTVRDALGNSTTATQAITAIAPAKLGTLGSISGLATVYPGTSNVTYSVTPVANAVSYTWTVTGGTPVASSTTNSIVVNYGPFTTASVSVIANGTCASTAAKVLAVKKGALGKPAISGAKTEYCGTSNILYFTKPVVGATSYKWAVPHGATIVSGQGKDSIRVNFTDSFASGNVMLYAKNVGDSTAVVSQAVTKTILAAPGGIVGAAKVFCETNNLVYSAKKVTNATVYTWTVPTGYTILSGQGTDTIVVNVSAIAAVDTISVKAGNGCSYGPAKILVVKKSTLAKPSSITGATSVFCGTAGVVYSIKPVTGATSYTWTAPAGAFISAGQGSTTATVNYTGGFNTVGLLSVVATNICDVTAAATLKVTPKILGTPAKIIGPASLFCGINTVIYSTPAVANATQYNWTVPAGMTIVHGFGTDSITVNIGDLIAGPLTVAASNGCSSSAIKSLTIVRTKLATPGTITGPTTILCGSTNVAYSITGVAGASKYTWTVPAGTIVSGQGTMSILVNFGSTISGGVSVQADGCDSTIFSSAKAITLKAGVLAPAVAIIGTKSSLVNQQGVKYYVAHVAGVTNNWTIPTAGATAVGSITATDTIVLNYTAFKTGTLSVISSNGCTVSKATALLLTSKSGAKLEEDPNDTQAPAYGQSIEFSNLYPNPASTECNIEILAADNTQVLIQVYDILGKVMMNKIVTLSKGSNTITNQVNYPSGLYIMKITDTNSSETYNKRLVIQ